MTKKVKSIGVIGLGSMGMGAAKSCINAGLDVYGIDLNPNALEELSLAGAKAVSSNALDFAKQLDAVLVLVVNAKQVNTVLFDTGLAAALNPQTVVMVSATISAEDAKAIEQKLAQHQLLMLDAPVSGGAAKAATGDMTVMASGSLEAFEKAPASPRCNGRESIQHWRTNWPWRDGQNHPPAACWCAYCRRRRSDGIGCPSEHSFGFNVRRCYQCSG